MIQPPYTDGIIRIASGATIVRGEGTAWALRLVNGGLLSFGGRCIPIASVESNTQLTLAYPSPAAFEGIYAIDMHSAEAATNLAASRRMADLLAALNGLSPFGAQLGRSDTAATARGLLEALSSADNAVTFAKLQDIAAATLVGRAAGSAGDPQALSAAQAKALLGLGIGDVSGLLSALTDRLTLAGGQMTGPITLARATSKNLVALPVNFTDNSGLYYGNFSGVLSITEHNNGNTAIFICGNGNVVLLGQTGTSFQVGIPASGGPSRVGCFYDQGSNGYAFWNRRGGPVQVSILSIEQRPAA